MSSACHRMTSGSLEVVFADQWNMPRRSLAPTLRVVPGVKVYTKLHNHPPHWAGSSTIIQRHACRDLMFRARPLPRRSGTCPASRHRLQDEHCSSRPSLPRRQRLSHQGIRDGTSSTTRAGVYSGSRATVKEDQIARGGGQGQTMVVNGDMTTCGATVQNVGSQAWAADLRWRDLKTLCDAHTEHPEGSQSGMT